MIFLTSVAKLYLVHWIKQRSFFLSARM